MSAKNRVVEFKNVLSKGVDALTNISVELRKDADKPKLTRILTILVNNFGTKSIDHKVKEYIGHSLRTALGTIGADECLQIGTSSICYNTNHVLAIALSIAYLKVKEQ